MGRKERLQRSEILIGHAGLEELGKKRVLVFGVGGVGGAVCEALARGGVGAITVVDGDVVDESNINRQIIATYNSLGKDKVDVMVNRLNSIAPDCLVEGVKAFILPDNLSDAPDFRDFDYIVDAVDTVAAKLAIIRRAKEFGLPVISAMGAGNKKDPTKFRIDDISMTKVCPLAKVVRKELRREKITGVMALYSTENPIAIGSSTPGSMSYVPPVAGYIIAGHVINTLLGDC